MHAPFFLNKPTQIFAAEQTAASHLLFHCAQPQKQEHEIQAQLFHKIYENQEEEVTKQDDFLFSTASELSKAGQRTGDAKKRCAYSAVTVHCKKS